MALFRGPGLLNFTGAAATVTVVLAWVLRARKGAFVALHPGVPLLARALGRDLDGGGRRAVFGVAMLVAGVLARNRAVRGPARGRSRRPRLRSGIPP